LTNDLPRAGLSAADVNAQRAAELRREARKLPTALAVLWTIWGAVMAVNLVVWLIVAVTTGFGVYVWPVWLLVPGAALGAVTVGVQSIRQQRRREQ
jgi:apolipoprotein N-acyltransferase